MTPLTPDHHFYMDQGTYARVRLVFMAIGRKLVTARVFAEPDDVLFLRYHELRVISANHAAFDAKALTAGRRKERTAAMAKRPRFWAGTITGWSFNDEPYKRGNWGWRKFILARKKPLSCLKRRCAVSVHRPEWWRASPGSSKHPSSSIRLEKVKFWCAR
jgi:hypothetical protein